MMHKVSFTPDLILRCPDTGYIVITECVNGYVGRVEMWHPDLIIIDKYMLHDRRLDPHNITGVKITRMDDLFGMTICTRDQLNQGLFTTCHYRTSSTTPSRMFSIDSMIYKVPTRLSDFIKLPLVHAHITKMIKFTWALACRWCIPQDIIAIILILMTRLHYERDHEQYCEQS